MKYKLKKDLPDIKAGTIFTDENCSRGLVVYRDEKYEIVYNKSEINFDEWFLPIRWKPEKGKYYYTIVSYIKKEEWQGDMGDDICYNDHNCFETREEGQNNINNMLDKLKK